MHRRIPLIVWALTLFGFLMSVSSSLIVPTYLGFDEPQHEDMVIALAHGDGWADPGTRYVSVGIAVSSGHYYSQSLAPRPLDKALDNIPPRGRRGTLDDAGGDAQSVGGNPNQIVQHPPLYYAIEALGMKALGAHGWSYDHLLELLRIITALILAPLPLLAWGIARRLGGTPAIGVTAAAFSLTVPGLTRVGGYVNNDALMVVTAAGMVLGLVHVATGDLSRRTAAMLGLATGLALLSKGFGLALLPLVPLAYVIGSRRNGVRARAAATPAAIALAAGFVTGGFWWLRNLIEFGALQPSGFGRAAQARLDGPPRAAGTHADLGPWLDGVRDRITRSFWGGAGVTSLPTTSEWVGTLLLVLVAVLVLVAFAWGMRGQANRATLVLITLPVPLVMVPFLGQAWKTYVKHGTLPGVQGRYLYLAIAGVAVVVAVALDRLLGRFAFLLPTLAVATALLLQAQGAYRLVRNAWLPPTGGSLRTALNHLEVLSPWSNGSTQAAFGLTALVALAVVGVATRDLWLELRPAAEPVPA